MYEIKDAEVQVILKGVGGWSWIHLGFMLDAPGSLLDAPFDRSYSTVVFLSWAMDITHEDGFLYS